MYKKTIIVAFILRLILFISLFILSLLFQSQAKKSPYKNLKRLQNSIYMILLYRQMIYGLLV